MPRNIDDPYHPGFRHAVWTRQDWRELDAWLRQARMQGRWWIEPTEVIFDVLEDAVMFELAWG